MLFILGRTQEAQSICCTLLREHPDNDDLRREVEELREKHCIDNFMITRKAIEYAQAGNRVLAIQLLANTLRQQDNQPDNGGEPVKTTGGRSQLILTLANTLRRNQQGDLAISWFKTGVSEFPRDSRMRSDYASLLSYRRDYNNAASQYRKALRLNPNDAYTWVGYGNMYERKGLFCNAIDCFDIARRLNPRNNAAKRGYNKLHEQGYNTSDQYPDIGAELQPVENQRKGLKLKIVPTVC